MDFGIRDWMIIIGVLLILAVLLDGYRRMRNEHRSKIRLSLNKQFLNAAEEELPLTELPGSVRRVERDRARSQQGSEQDLQLEQSVPMLMESVAAQQQQATEQESLDNPADDKEQPPEQSNSGQRGEGKVSPASIAEVIVVNVMARDEGGFKGPDLLHILLACDMRFGDMNIFHRYEKANGTGPIQFSVANVVEPGTFDLDDIDNFSTPGVSFFLGLPGPRDAMTAYDYMVETAQVLVKNLEGELLDESRSVMTAQTLEHCRQRVRDYERRQLTQA
jgi:cell division protein ZipA